MKQQSTEQNTKLDNEHSTINSTAPKTKRSGSPIFEGACTALVTPFHKGEVDFVSFGKLIEFQIKNGIDALLVLGTTGEASTLSMTEKQQIVHFSIAQVASRVPLLVGIGGNNPAAIIEFGKFLTATNAECKSQNKGGIDGVLLSSPYYNKATQDGVVLFFKTIAKEVPLPIIAYNVPGRTGMNMTPETMARICKIKNVVGIKEASGSITQVAETLILCPKTAVYSGDDALSLPAYTLGARGVISVASNVTPATVAEIYRLSKKRKSKPAQQLFFSDYPFYKALFCEVNPIPVKYVLSRKHLCKNELRLPLTPLSDKFKTTLDEL